MFDDLRLAIRVFQKSSAFALACAGTLALAIGASLAIFCVVYGILLRPLPVLRQAARLLMPAIGIGLIGAALSVRLLSSQLFGVSA